ncbi:septation protein SepH [Curtobacterium sp. RRHDQ10]|uniref:septation protein SepH n=1 Tax=Curtobacterium phyllosphaerae TaxID=3413379 RepID=UPI003BF322D4
MQDVRVIGVEAGALLLATDQGSEFRLGVTSSLPAQVRQANPDAGPQKRVSPKDVQARIRGGLSAEQVAETMDVDVEYVRRFEGPVLAERAFILDAAGRVPLAPRATGRHGEEPGPGTFGEAIADRLAAGDATDIAWTSWKHPETGWQIRVAFTAAEVDHEAQWRFDPKTSMLTPENPDAHRLTHDDEDEGLTPRLRAVEYGDDDTDSTRFDSGAFHVDGPEDRERADRVLDPEVAPDRGGAERPPVDRHLRAPLPRIGTAPVEERAPGNETADLLEALRRRRGERESATFAEHSDGSGRIDGRRGSVTVVDIPLDMGEDDVSDTAEHPTLDDRSAAPASAPEPGSDGRPERRKRARRSMPSWDEIVFGTRSDDDLA